MIFSFGAFLDRIRLGANIRAFALSNQKAETLPTVLQVAELVEREQRMVPWGHAKALSHLRRRRQTKASRNAPETFN
jgi:hypothetical protein